MLVQTQLVRAEAFQPNCGFLSSLIVEVMRMLSWRRYYISKGLKLEHWFHFWSLRLKEAYPNLDLDVELLREDWERIFVPIFDRWVDILEGTFADFE